MIAAASSDFIKEFTLYAERATKEHEAVFIQRANDDNVILLPQSMYNEMQREIYQLKQLLANQQKN